MTLDEAIKHASERLKTYKNLTIINGEAERVNAWGI